MTVFEVSPEPSTNYPVVQRKDLQVRQMLRPLAEAETIFVHIIVRCESVLPRTSASRRCRDVPIEPYPVLIVPS
jgi:hypothetical protein